MEEEVVDKYRNWKSSLAFFLFLTIYAYSVYSKMDSSTIDITGYIALLSMSFMMLRDKRLGNLIDKALSIKLGKKEV